MKKLSVLTITLLSMNLCGAQPDQGDIIIAHLLHEESLKPDPIIREVQSRSPAEQSSVLNTVVQRVQELRGKEESKYEIHPSHYISVAAGVLGALGTDEQIIAAFGELSEFGEQEDVAAVVLGLCKGNKGVEIIEKLAMQRITEFQAAYKQMGPDGDADRSTRQKIQSSFSFTLGLACSPQPQAQAAAARIRIVFAYQLKGPKLEASLAMADEEFRSKIQQARLERGSSVPVVWPPNENQESANEDAPKTPDIPPNYSRPWPWLMGLLISVIGIGLWLWKKRSK